MAQFIMFHPFKRSKEILSARNSVELHRGFKKLREDSLNEILIKFPMIRKLGVDSTMSFVEIPDETEALLVNLLKAECKCILFKAVL